MPEEILKPEEQKPVEAAKPAEEVKPVEEAPKEEVTPVALEDAVKVVAEVKEEVAEEVKPPEEKPAEEKPAVEEKPKLTDKEIEQKVNQFVNQGKAPVSMPDFKTGDGKVDEKAAQVAKDYQETQDPAKLVELIQTVGMDIGKSIVQQIVHTEATQKIQNMMTDADKIVYTKYPELMDVHKAASKVAEEKKGNFTKEDVAETYGKDLPEISLVMTQVYQDMPELLKVPDGAVKAMRVAEDRIARKATEKPTEEEKPAVDVEAIKADAEERANRGRAAAVVASGASGVPDAKTGVESLSDIEIQMASNLGVTREEYAARKDNKYIHDAKYYNKDKTTAIKKAVKKKGGGA